MNLFDFIERFPGEEECISFFIETRQKAGILCRKCGSNKHVWSAEIDRFECEKCGNRIGVKSGTLMENSKLPIKHWFVAIQLLTSETDKYTISEIQEKQSGAEPEQINRMLASLNSCLENPGKGQSFDQLLMTCIANHNHPPATKKASQKN